VAGIDSGNRIPFAEFIKRRKGFLLIIFLIILNILGLQLFYALNKNDTILPHEKLLYEYRLKNPRIDYIDNLDTYEKIYKILAKTDDYEILLYEEGSHRDGYVFLHKKNIGFYMLIMNDLIKLSSKYSGDISVGTADCYYCPYTGAVTKSYAVKEITDEKVVMEYTVMNGSIYSFVFSKGKTYPAVLTKADYDSVMSRISDAEKVDMETFYLYYDGENLDPGVSEEHYKKSLIKPSVLKEGLWVERILSSDLTRLKVNLFDKAGYTTEDIRQFAINVYGKPDFKTAIIEATIWLEKTPRVTYKVTAINPTDEEFEVIPNEYLNDIYNHLQEVN
jgi:hypothetical protein